MSVVMTITLWALVLPVLLLALRVLKGPQLGPWSRGIAFTLAATIALLGLDSVAQNWLPMLPAILILMTLPTFWLLYKTVQREHMSTWERRRDPPSDTL